jgi:hypothetical protein
MDCAYGAKVTDTHGFGVIFEPFNRGKLIDRNYIGMSTFVHRRSLIERCGGFDESLDALEDWDLILRYTAHAPAFRLPVLAVRYRVMDEKRILAIRSHATSVAKIRNKWALTEAGR